MNSSLSNPLCFARFRVLSWIALVGVFLPVFDASSQIQQAPIDRQALVERHNPKLSAVDPLSPFTLGNGSFAFTTDITGLQSFPEAYQDSFPLSIQSEWGWHSFPNTEGYRIEDTYENFEVAGRPVPYPTLQHTDAGRWLRGNPHRLGLGRIGFEILDESGNPVPIEAIHSIDQTLDLWRGQLKSRFTVDGQPVSVTTVCHPDSDLIAVTVESPLLEAQRLKILATFPYGTSDWGTDPGDWHSPEKHRSVLSAPAPNRIQIDRALDQTRYHFALQSGQPIVCHQVEPHRFSISPAEPSNKAFAFTFHFADSAADSNKVTTTQLPSAPATIQSSSEYWNTFWKSGGAIDLSQSSDPRASELERRIVLSQYLTAVQCRGKLPPQETGLTYNSWYGKPHLEMHWWHLVHFALWDRLETVETALDWYAKILPKAQAIARVQGYAGARWPKNVDAEGNQVPSTISPLLIWQQPHPIYFAELCYRQNPTQATLEAYQRIVFETADFMASFPHGDADSETLNLGPPLIPAQESYDAKTTSNPPFELAYWRWGLATAQQWRQRLGLQPDQKWDEVLQNLAPYPVHEDVYATAEGIWNIIDHPSVLAAFGMIRGDGIDRDRMRRTLRRVFEEYDWEHTWGWDYPMIAMTAARLGEPELAIQALLMDVPKNRYLPNGHNFQTSDRLRLYLPGNGGLLAAVAMMAAGWDGAPDTPHPGFPQTPAWTVRAENLHRFP